MRILACPGCEREVSSRAAVCPSCRAELALCSWCHDLTTLDEGESRGRLRRTRHVCGKCHHPGVRCRTAGLGGYCNGLARDGGLVGAQLCTVCSATALDAAKTVTAWTLIGLVSSRLRPKG
jgi:hypothetical protein